MTEINQINQNKINFQGTKKMNNENKPETIEDFANTAVKNLAERAEREVPQDGDFAPVSERYINHNPDVYANEMLLQVVPLPQSLKNEPNYNKLRYLQAVVKSPLEQTARSVLLCGTTTQVLEALNDEKLPLRAAAKFDELAEDLRMN